MWDGVGFADGIRPQTMTSDLPIDQGPGERWIVTPSSPGSYAASITAAAYQVDTSIVAVPAIAVDATPLKALVWGIAVVYAFPKWIGGDAGQLMSGSTFPIAHRDDEARLEMFRRLAWAQWSLDEITSGEAFNRLLEMKC